MEQDDGDGGGDTEGDDRPRVAEHDDEDRKEIAVTIEAREA